jgi:hypothetical protein
MILYGQSLDGDVFFVFQNPLAFMLNHPNVTDPKNSGFVCASGFTKIAGQPIHA